MPAQRPRAPSVQRRRRDRRLLHRLGQDAPSTRDLLPHEYTHSWNGKFRRPADLWTPNYNVPMRDSLLWVYEGQTQYWGTCWPPARASGPSSRRSTRSPLTAANYDDRAGRDWRPLQDTTNDAIIDPRRPLSWRSWQRCEDYYAEGALIWLDADTLIRERSGGKRSLDDFARAFFGIDDGSFVTVTYTFDDVVAALNAVAALRLGELPARAAGRHGPTRRSTASPAAATGWSTPTRPAITQRPPRRGARSTDFTYSLGFVVGKDGDAQPTCSGTARPSRRPDRRQPDRRRQRHRLQRRRTEGRDQARPRPTDADRAARQDGDRYRTVAHRLSRRPALPASGARPGRARAARRHPEPSADPAVLDPDGFRSNRSEP